ncbi:MAG TPA: biotin--[acetyl-CoA-carboxylase] ligase, partial [Acidimicrobiales bacterium]|nr:biotin--[acetyl-CoA-carboxylase] ligase [Acidimicrobiales bacterium]
FEMVAATGSTNGDLVARAAGPAGDGLVLAAEHQSAGRGRLDRRWEAPAGTNLTFSTLLRPEWLTAPDEGSPDRPGLVTSALAVSVAEVLETLGLDAAVKWPNDVLLVGEHPGKGGGILAELVTGERPAIVVGLGLNVGWPPPESAISDEPVPPGATSLARAGVSADRWRVMVDVLVAFDRQLATLDSPDGPERLRQDHLVTSATVGSRVRVEQASGDLIGEAVDLTVDGGLVVVPDGGDPVEVHAGDVTHLREG